MLENDSEYFPFVPIVWKLSTYHNSTKLSMIYSLRIQPVILFFILCMIMKINLYKNAAYTFYVKANCGLWDTSDFCFYF